MKIVDDDVRVEVDAIWALLSMEIGAAETLNPARVLPTEGANRCGVTTANP